MRSTERWWVRPSWWRRACTALSARSSSRSSPRWRGAIPDRSSQATVQLTWVPFLSDVALQDALTQAGVDPAVTQAALDINRQARVDGLRSALSVLALIALLGLFVARRVPDHPQLAAADAAPSGTGPPAGPDEAPTVVG